MVRTTLDVLTSLLFIAIIGGLLLKTNLYNAYYIDILAKNPDTYIASEIKKELVDLGYNVSQVDNCIIIKLIGTQNKDTLMTRIGYLTGSSGLEPPSQIEVKDKIIKVKWDK